MKRSPAVCELFFFFLGKAFKTWICLPYHCKGFHQISFLNIFMHSDTCTHLSNIMSHQHYDGCKYLFKCMCGRMLPSPYPALQLRGKLCLKLAGGPFTVVPLDEDFVGQRCTVPQLLQIVELKEIKHTHTQTKNNEVWYSHAFIMSPQRKPFTLIMCTNSGWMGRIGW